MSGHDHPEQAVTFKRNGWSRWAGIRMYRYFAVLALQALGRIAVTAVTGAPAFRRVLLVPEVFVQFGIEGGLDGELDQLLSEGSEIFFGFDVLGQLGGHGSEFFLVQLRIHDGILLKRLLSRRQLHNLVYRLF